jgi:hypothetical protein
MRAAPEWVMNLFHTRGRIAIINSTKHNIWERLEEKNMGSLSPAIT